MPWSLDLIFLGLGFEEVSAQHSGQTRSCSLPLHLSFSFLNLCGREVGLGGREDWFRLQLHHSSAWAADLVHIIQLLQVSVFSSVQGDSNAFLIL